MSGAVYVAANVAWNSNGWRGLPEEGEETGFGWVASGNTPNEAWNFDLENPRNSGFVYGYVQDFSHARIAKARLLFVTSRTPNDDRYVVGFYVDAEPIETPWEWNEPPSASGVDGPISFRVSIGNCFPFPEPFLVPWDLAKYYSDKYRRARKWPGRNNYIYMEEANAIELLKAVVRRHRKYAADNPMHSAAALAVASAASRFVGRKEGKASNQLPAADQVQVPESDLLEAERRKIEATRLLRYAPVLVKLKRAYGNTCQVDASHRLALPDSAPYCEVHHLKPVAEGGALADETFSNCVVVCPSCHILLQYRALWIDPKDGRTLRHFQRDRKFEGKKLRLVDGHVLSKQVLKEVVARPADSPREAAQPGAAADAR